jgi:acyl transferase domain-containing protein/NADPH:quinone reductase-like Zn-dependent oxidoreductase/NAD(P)-dependent dehydrogenase (short-subunit alcohol dehydrogenase family)/ubiquinone/menaquinone biosynthesis C-methylase UbiE/acyl carrier protein
MKLAVIGLGCRFPGSSNNPSQFFEHLVQGKDCLVETPRDRWNLDWYKDSDDNKRAGKMVPGKGGFIDDLFSFDNDTFSMSAKEAQTIDPQQRVLLEVTLQALEDSKIEYRGTNTGVFIGAGASDYAQLSTRNPWYVNEYSAPGTSAAIFANRLSFAFDLRGPSYTVDTACSASASALHLASRCIENGDCDQAVIGGVNLLLNPSMTVAFSKLGVLSPDCKCKSFDASANGYVRSEGCGVIVVRSLEDAVRDGNHIYLVINTVRCNEDGGSSPSLTMPSSVAQEQLIMRTLKDSGVNPHDIFYVEAHATGTKVGDPIEANAIGKLAGLGRNPDNVLRIGCVKPNVGHLEFASCMASLIKCALMMDNGQLVPTINFKNPNPKIEFDKYSLRVQTQNEKFDKNGKIMMISSFGFGGANSCIIVEAPPAITTTTTHDGDFKLTRTPYVYVTSAMSKKALLQRIQQLKDDENSDKPEAQHSLMYSLNSNNQHGDNKYIAYGMGNDLKSAKFVDPIENNGKLPVVFVFSGQGPQNIEMGRQLYAIFPRFKQAIDECDALFQKYGNVSVIKDYGLFGAPISGQDKNFINRIEVTLAGLILMQIGLFELWKSFGVVPDAIMGHSFGEMCAIYASGASSLDDIIQLTVMRSHLMQQLKSEGTMIAVGCGPQEALDIIAQSKIDQLWIAAINSPQSVTCGGAIPSVHKFAAICKERNLFNRILNVTNAFHTPLMSQLRDEAEHSFQQVTAVTDVPRIPVISTVTGEMWDKPFDYHYFWSNIENKVLFSKAIDCALEKFGKDCVFVEMAPHPVLSMSIKQCSGTNIVYSQHRQEDSQATLLNTAAKLMTFGVKINWANVIGKGKVNRNVVPLYPFQRKFFHSEPDECRELRLPNAFGTLLGLKLVHHETTYQNFISTKSYDWLQDHVVQGSTIFPGAGYIELIMESVGKSVGSVVIKNPLLVPTDTSFTTLQTKVKDNDIVEIYSKREGDNSWTLHAVGAKRVVGPMVQCDSIQALKDKCKVNVLNKEECYKRFQTMNLDYAHFFQLIDTLYQGDEEALALLDISHIREKSRYVLHPAILDCCFQAFLGAIQSSAYTYLPTKLQHIDVFRTIEDSETHVYAYCTITTLYEKEMIGDIIIMDAHGKTLCRITEFTCTKIGSPKPHRDTYYTTMWQRKHFPAQPDLATDLQATLSEDETQWNEVLKNKHIIDRALSHYISKLNPALFTDEQARATLSSAQKKNLAWLEQFMKENPTEEQTTEQIEKDFISMSHFQVEAKSIMQVGHQLEDLITKADNAARILNELMPSLLESSLTFKSTVRALVQLITKLQVEKHRVVRVLELGAGPGVVTRKVLPILKQLFDTGVTTSRIEYYYTDSATTNLNIEHIKDYQFVQSRTVDLDKPLEEQGIEKQSIDIVIACNTLHNSSNLSQALQNIQRTMVPDGLLFIAEPTKTAPYLNFLFGISRGWWNQEDNSTTSWAQALEKSGFKSIQYHSGHVNSVITAVKDVEYNKEETKSEIDVCDGYDVLQLLDFVQQRQSSTDVKPLYIVTKDAQMECKNPADAAVVGFARVITSESPTWQVRCVDFQSNVQEQERYRWLTRLQQYYAPYENEIAIRNDEVWVPRLVQKRGAEQSQTTLQVKPFRLEIPSDGILSSLRYHQFDTTVSDGMVLVQTKAAALNFKDVMLAMNMLDIEKRHLGLEFSGIVVKTGKGVERFQVGDEVYGISDHCLASHVIASQDLIVKKPSNISFEEASTIPIVFLTTYYALIHKANIQEGDKVLVHSAAGGVGQAAIQLINWKKAETIATVSNEKKRQFLREKYGVTMFADSHSADWHNQIKEFSHDGVDVVLNSLAGDNIEKGLASLRACGSFIEIGKRDILENNPMHLGKFLNNLSYFSVHLDYLIDTHAKQLNKMLTSITELFAQGVLSTFVDHVYPAKDIVEAFRYMQSGKHMGKIVISFSEQNYPAQSAILPSVHLFSADKTYVLSGGMGAVGFVIAKWMVDQGARHIVLFSRNATKQSKDHIRGLKAMEKKGARVFVSQTDVTNAEQVKECYRKVQEMSFPKIAGLVHLAMVLEDDMIIKQTKERFNKVITPKIKGAHNLVDNVDDLSSLDFVLFFSSISSVIGNAEQSNYSAANAYLDAYAAQLRNSGVNASVINMGAVDDVGVIANDYRLRKIMLARGIDTISVAEVLEYLRIIISSRQSSISQFITPYNVQGVCEFNPSLNSRMSHLIQHEHSDVGANSGAAASVDGISKQIEKILQLDTAVDIHEKLTSYGVDSLLAVEISSMLNKMFGIKISQMDILSGITVAQLQEKLGNKE